MEQGQITLDRQRTARWIGNGVRFFLAAALTAKAACCPDWLGLVSATPALALIPQMNRRGKVVISACLVSCVCSFGAHFAFANNVAPEVVPAMLTAKLLGGVLGGGIALFVTRNMKE